MKNSTYVVGVGMTKFCRMPERSFEEIGREAVRKALADAGIDRNQVREVFCGSALTGRSIGQRVLRDLGMTGIPITNVENACSSGSTALREASAAIASDRADVVLVLGIDQLSRLGGGTIPGVETDLDPNLGMVMPALYAMRAQRYLHERGATREHLAKVAVKAHRAGKHNPYAQYRNEVTIVSDGSFGELPPIESGIAELRVQTIGTSSDNQAVVSVYEWSTRLLSVVRLRWLRLCRRLKLIISKR